MLVHRRLPPSISTAFSDSFQILAPNSGWKERDSERINKSNRAIMWLHKLCKPHKKYFVQVHNSITQPVSNLDLPTSMLASKPTSPRCLMKKTLKILSCCKMRLLGQGKARDKKWSGSSLDHFFIQYLPFNIFPNSYFTAATTTTTTETSSEISCHNFFGKNYDILTCKPSVSEQISINSTIQQDQLQYCILLRSCGVPWFVLLSKVSLLTWEFYQKKIKREYFIWVDASAGDFKIYFLA